MSLIKNKTEIIYLSILVLLLFSGRNFADYSFLNFPGKITDQIILFLIFFNLKIYKSLAKQYKWYLLIIILSVLIGIHTKNVFLIQTSSISMINFIGQDLLFLIYPLLLIPIISKFEFNLLQRKFYLLVFFTEIFFIFDFIFERAYFIKKFLIFDFSFISKYITYFNLVDLKASEITLVNLFFIIILIKNYRSQSKNFYLSLILIGCVFGFYSTQNRATLISLFLFTFLLIIHKIKYFKVIFLIFIGFIFSFLFYFEINDNMVKDFAIEISENSSNLESSSTRVRLHSEKCISVFNKSYSECEIIVPNNEFEDLIKKLILLRKIDSSIKEFIKIPDSLNEFKEINSFIDCEAREKVCKNILKEPYFSSLNEIETLYCGDSTAWRLNLWYGALNYFTKNTFKIFFGYGVGFAIPELLVEDRYIQELCYFEIINSANPLRSLHNTFLTILFRFGIVGFSLFLYLLFKLFKKENNLFLVYLLPLLFLTFTDSLFDSPIALFISIYLYYFDKRLNNIDNFV